MPLYWPSVHSGLFIRAAGYVPVQVVQSLPPGTNETVPAVVMGDATGVAGTNPAVFRVVNGTMTGPKVRYYVREYGVESDAEVANRRR